MENNVATNYCKNLSSYKQSKLIVSQIINFNVQSLKTLRRLCELFGCNEKNIIDLNQEPCLKKVFTSVLST